MKKLSLKEKDKQILEFVKKGGRKGAKKDFFKLLKKAVTSRSSLKQSDQEEYQT